MSFRKGLLRPLPGLPANLLQSLDVLRAMGMHIATDFAHIQDAADRAEGGALFIPPGEWEPFTISDNCYVLGAGRGTVVKLPDNSPAGTQCIKNKDQTNGNSGIIIANLMIDGNRANQPGGTYNTTNLRFYKVTDFIISHVWSKSPKNFGMALFNCERGTIESPFISDYEQEGLGIHYSKHIDVLGGKLWSTIATEVNLDVLGSDHITVDGTHIICTGQSSGNSGLVVEGGWTDIKVLNVFILEASGTGLSCANPDITGQGRLILQANEVEKCGDSGIVVVAEADASVRILSLLANICYDNGGHGMRIAAAGGVMNKGSVGLNQCDNNDLDGIRGVDVTDISFVGNQCEGNGQWGLRLDGNDDYCAIGANVLRGNTSGPLSTTGANHAVGVNVT